MIRNIIASLSFAAMVALSTGCTDSCSGLTATERDREAAANGYEVEKKGNMGATCELQEDGTWKVDD